MPLCILFMLLSVLFYPYKNHIEFYLMIASFFSILITLIVTLVTELPIVNKIRRWTVQTMPSDWEATRDKWTRFNSLRVFPALVSFGLYLAAILFHF